MSDAKAAVFAAAKELLKDRPCPGCGGNRMRIPAKYYTLMEQFDPPATNATIQVNAIQVVPVSCNRCGLMRLYDTRVLEDPEARDPKNRV
jgi:hypothetical protein